MHDRRRIRDAVTARLLSQVGALFAARIHPGRAGAIMIGEEVPLVLVDVQKSAAEIYDEQAHAERVSYLLEVAVVAAGPSPELAAEGEQACADELDDLALPVRRALTRAWALGGGLVLPGAGRAFDRVVDWRFAGDDLVIKPGGKAGHVAHLVQRFTITVVNGDGNPSSEE